MKNKILVGLSLLLVLMVGGLYLTSKISDAYTTASKSVLNDPAIAREYGTQQYLVLVGESFKLGPEWSCASLLFVVRGAKGAGVVEVLLRRKKIYRDPWVVLGVTSGYYTKSQISCQATA